MDPEEIGTSERTETKPGVSSRVQERRFQKKKDSSRSRDPSMRGEKSRAENNMEK